GTQSSVIPSYATVLEERIVIDLYRALVLLLRFAPRAHRAADDVVMKADRKARLGDVVLDAVAIVRERRAVVVAACGSPAEIVIGGVGLLPTVFDRERAAVVRRAVGDGGIQGAVEGQDRKV